MRPSLIQDSLGIFFVRFFNRQCVFAQRVSLEIQMKENLAHFLTGCYQNRAMISNLRSACRLAQSAVCYSSFYVRSILAHVAAPSLYGSGLGHRLFPGAGFSRIRAGTLEASSLRLSCRLRRLNVPALGRDC